MVKAEEKKHVYPVFLRLEKLQTLLLGGGDAALEKLRLLLSDSPDARIVVMNKHIKEEVKVFLESYPSCTIIQRSFDETDLQNKDIIILTTEDEKLNKHVALLARAKGLLINVSNVPELSSFHLGKTLHKGNMNIAVSANERFPSGTKKMREVLNKALPGELDEAIDLLQTQRRELNNGAKYKKKKLNSIARVFVNEDEKNNRWRKIVTWSLLAFAFMLIGHFIFSYLPLQQMAEGTYKWYQNLDKAFPVMLLAGFLAQLVDGALGMGYGVTSATILLSAGVSPAAMSGSIHTAEIFASGASGYSHYKFGNVNKKLFKALLIPGVLGAIGGAILLVLMGDKYSNYVKPVIAAYTLALGIKFVINAFRGIRPQKKFRRYRLLAAVGGFFDSFGGGGWGPIVTSTLINNGRSHKYVVGSVSLTEFFVTLASAFTFFTMIGVSHWQTILALVIGGLVAAPIAAKLAGKLPRRTSFMLLGALVIFWSIRILIKTF